MNINNNNETISSFFCPKCETIPQIEIYPKDNHLNILVSCKCHKQLLKYDIFYKNYFKQNLKKNAIKNIKNKKYISDELNNEVNKQISNYEINRDIFYEKLLEIKNGLIENLNFTIKKIEKIYEQNKDINDKIDTIMKILINNYNSNPYIEINIKNIFFNTQKNTLYKKKIDFNSKKLLMNISQIYNENYIIKPYRYNLIKRYISYGKDNIMVEIKKGLFAINYNGSIKIGEINKEEVILKTPYIKNLLTDEKKEYLISHEIDNTILFRNINEIEKLYKNNQNKQKNLDLSPAFKIKFGNEISELISFENNMLCGSNSKSVFVCKYDINEQNFQIIKKIDNNLKNLMIIKRKNKKYLICKYDNCLVIAGLPELKLVNMIQVGKWENELFYYEQINEDEILIGYNKCIKIYNLKNFKITLTKKIYLNIMSLKKLDDNTILVGGRNEVKRFSLKTLEELPKLIDVDESCLKLFDDDDNELGLNLSINENDVRAINQTSEGYIMVFLGYDIKIYGINFNDFITSNK